MKDTLFLETYFKENNSRKDTVLPTICSKIYSELRQTNEMLQTFGLQALKAERDVDLIRKSTINANTALVYLIQKTNNKATQEIRHEVQNPATRLADVEKQTADHKPVVHGIKSCLEQAQKELNQQKEKKEDHDFTFLQ
ncbi:MAG: hypothetical protein DLM72_13220 [Candidatus Nitrosopolaris wilkensis]|nr:MAG: hypothetical protein DLM72_13220 [Candidatus Nitrosopolaris wilkensis]